MSLLQIQAGLPQLLLVKELMTALVNDEDSYGECGTYPARGGDCLESPVRRFFLMSSVGYYLATLEAATQHIFDLAEQYEKSSADALQHLDANGEDIVQGFDDKLNIH
jgi:hypothetical protein